MKLGRAAFGPARAVARSGRSALTDEVERAIDAVLVGPMPEAVARSAVRHRVVERVIAAALEASPGRAPGPGVDAAEIERALERALGSPGVQRALNDALESKLTEELALRTAQSAAFRQILHEVLSSAELRSALMQQTTGFGAELTASLRRRTRGLDDSTQSAVRRLLGRPAAEVSRFGGLSSRGVALVTDAAFAQLAFLVVAASVGLVISLVGNLRAGWLDGLLAGGGWFAVVSLYFVSFWTATGQTPGMRIMRLRVVTQAGGPPTLWRSLIRLVGLVLAIVPLFAGFLPVIVDARRRALQDFLAGTLVCVE
jgi:uncharacterized RDD family membrane protein YckC